MNGIDEVNNVQVGMSRMKPDKKKNKKIILSMLFKSQTRFKNYTRVN